MLSLPAFSAIDLRCFSRLWSALLRPSSMFCGYWIGRGEMDHGCSVLNHCTPFFAPGALLGSASLLPVYARSWPASLASVPCPIALSSAWDTGQCVGVRGGVRRVHERSWEWMVWWASENDNYLAFSCLSWTRSRNFLSERFRSGEESFSWRARPLGDLTGTTMNM